uniref:Transmembrane protein n=1 Tax=Chromera velia CCMP2878 TaxID=1169474 RepID=A0A0G4H1V3_9ALVE|eukprot:Cvel_24363.t1-p1 / transcript=Cvel_24363.t1 / gene=Cvel_24363 / organism=Chromera_velia_CCMP2878 / gene_product=hypothetical protein / transcript_product=hypothetical protein / location=Cvel_scaffold2622:16804-17673(-) / protein_length=290 / sequence_SO=supercontig / SO=protein_coding / is_pseudo=false
MRKVPERVKGRGTIRAKEREKSVRPPFSVLGCLIFWLGVPFCAYLGFLRHFLDLSVPFLARGSAFSRSRGGMEGQKCHLQEEEASEREKRHKMSSESTVQSSGREGGKREAERRGSGEVEGGEGQKLQHSPSCFPSPSSSRSAGLPDHSERSSSAPSQSAKEPVEHFRASPPDPAFEGDGAVFSTTPSADSAGSRFQSENGEPMGWHWEEGGVRKRDSLFSISSFEARGGRTEHADEVSDGVALLLGLCLLVLFCWVLKRLRTRRKVCRPWGQRKHFDALDRSTEDTPEI